MSCTTAGYTTVLLGDARLPRQQYRYLGLDTRSEVAHRGSKSRYAVWYGEEISLNALRSVRTRSVRTAIYFRASDMVQSTSFGLRVGIENALILALFVEIDFILSQGDRNWCDLSEGIGIDFVFMWVVEIDVLVSGHRNRLNFIVGIGIDFISVLGSKLTWFSAGGSNFRCLFVSAEGNFVSAKLWKLTWLKCGDWNWLGFRARVETNLFLYGRWNWLDFCVGGRNYLISLWGIDFRAGIEMDLILV